MSIKALILLLCICMQWVVFRSAWALLIVWLWRCVRHGNGTPPSKQQKGDEFTLGWWNHHWLLSWIFLWAHAEPWVQLQWIVTYLLRIWLWNSMSTFGTIVPRSWTHFTDWCSRTDLRNHFGNIKTESKRYGAVAWGRRRQPWEAIKYYRTVLQGSRTSGSLI